ncbi:hypothetical protein [Persicirhabdus sediminis]|uniref:Uncharacterized protein n=1 Tax=Persicirhabdus sediminis TaxID=454144 RepID=A0A8J7MF14_9BACT|nr:hypothetical protein [Persicirhabdus sediminis]MBK1792171.1 hypothetical protein [Persicirhabdus sediminis]
MKKTFFSLIAAAATALAFSSCASEPTSEFSPAGPQSNASTMPQNLPQAGEGAGMFGALQQQ